ncbi:hypothetical protein [Deefgea piscis]|uniref:hypothetical protein n=1 Tax=Deefgea piscis TaxID=2739061 RepID=UPI001C7FEB5F|nr:hypothetical protein [Deefgea piscis]QZA82578.1 hypothetical protein K4H25_08090 [Deefgea piscis]
MSASYHEALNTNTPPKLDSTKESQNYLYKTIQDHASSSIDVQFDNQRQLKSAKLEKSAQQSTHTLRYEMDKLTKETRLPEQAHFIQDLLTTMNSLQKRLNDSETDLLLKKQKLGELNEMIFLNTDPFRLEKTTPIQAFQRQS